VAAAFGGLNREIHLFMAAAFNGLKIQHKSELQLKGY